MSNTKSSFAATAAWSLTIVLAMFILFALLILPGVRYGNHGVLAHGYHPPAAARNLTEFAPIKGQQAPGIDLALALKGDPALAARANEIYSSVCTACHGPQGRGDGPAGKALGARDFTQKDGWKQGTRRVDIFHTLTKGLPPLMPAYDTYTPAERFALANLVSGFGAFDHGKASPAEIAALDAEYALSAGVKEPNQVSVAVAMQAIADEAQPARLDLARLSPGQAVLIADPARAATALAGLPADLESDARARALVAGAPNNGFQVALARLDGAAWSTFESALASALTR